MRMNQDRWRRRMGIATVGVAGLVALTACGGTTSAGTSTGGAAAPAEVTKITASSLTDDTAMPLWLANKLGYFKENNLEVTIQYAASGAAALPAGIAGDWQAGWIGAPPALSGFDKWGLISFPHIKEENNLKLLMRNDALKGSTPAEVLRTQKVGTGANSTFQNLLFACAKHFGVKPQELQIVPLDPPQVRQALAAKQIAAGTSAAAADYDLVQDTAQYTKVCDGTMAKASFISSYMVTPKFVKDNPEAAARFVSAVYKANEYVNDHPAEAIKYMVEFDKSVGLDTNEARAEYTLKSRTWVTLDKAISDMSDGTTKKTLTDLSDFFVEVGVYKTKPDVGTLVDKGLSVLQSAKKYRDGKK